MLSLCYLYALGKQSPALCNILHNLKIRTIIYKIL